MIYWQKKRGEHMRDYLIRVKAPEEMGLSSRAILDFYRDHSGLGLHSLALVRGGKVYALSCKPWREDLPQTLFSLSKSFCSMAAGLAVDEGLLRYEDSVADVLPDCLPRGYDPALEKVTLRHLLSMSSGLDPRSDGGSLRGKRDWARTALGFRVLHQPGTQFHYNTLGTYLAGRMVARRTGMSLRDYLLPRLFLPLGIRKPQWDCCPLGYNTAGFGLHLSCLDIAKVAQLLLDGGVHEGRPLLSRAYLDLATRRQVDNRNELTGPVPSDWEVGYGFQFWMSKHGRFRGDGMFGQVMMIDEKNDLALAVTAGLNDMGAQMDALHALMDSLLSLPPADAAGRAALRALEADLAWPVPEDDGSELLVEGSYAAKDGRLLRLETPDQDTLRLFYRQPGSPLPAVFTLTRGAARAGESQPLIPGEGPQPTLCRFGVHEGLLKAQVLMPEAPYRLEMQIRQAGSGLQVSLDSVGFDAGDFLFRPADRKGMKLS
ncbi:MAG: serine hydrolase domain-containing protein [Christensenellales bacterium]